MFNPRDKSKILYALKRVVQQALFETRSCPRRCSYEAVQLLRGNINKQAFLPYASYSKRYRKWKIEQGYPLIFWKLSGELIQAIRSHRMQPNVFMAGIGSNAYDSGGKSYYGDGRRVRISLYANVLEYGGRYGKAGNHPARPVFRPTKKQYEKGPLQKQGVVSLKKIARKWA